MNHTFTKILVSFFLKRNIFLSAAFAFLGLTSLSYVIVGNIQGSTFEEKYLFDVQSKVNKEIQKSNLDLDKVVATISSLKEFRFGSLLTKTEYPYFVFNNGKLIYWSDYQFVPDYLLIKGNYVTKGVLLETGKSILNRRLITVEKNNLEVYSVLNLYYSNEYSVNGLREQYNTNIFKLDPQEISVSPSATNHYLNIYGPSKSILFSISILPSDNFKSYIISSSIVISGLMCLLFTLIYLFTWLWYLNNSHRYGLAFVILVGFLVVLRGILLFYSIPFSFYDSELFNPKYFNASTLSPSLGDLILNLFFFVFVLTYLVNYYYKMRAYLWLVNLSNPIKQIITVVLIIGSFGITQFVYRVLEDIYQKSNNELSLALNIDIWEKPLVVFSLLVYILIALIYFLSCHFLIILVIKLNRRSNKWMYISLLIALFFSSIVVLVFSNFSAFVFGLHCVYLLVLFYTSFPRYLYTFRYQTSIYFFCGALICAGIGSYVVYQENIQEDFNQKKSFAKRYFDENDEKAEFLLSKASLSISRDSAIVKLMKSDFLPQEQVENYVKHNLLDTYFSYYDVQVFVFDSTGKSLDNNGEIENYQTFEKRFRLPNYQTKNGNIFFLNNLEASSNKQYFNFIPILSKENTPNGYVILDLKRKSQFTDNINNESSIFTGTKLNANTYSFAIYEKGKILKTGGEGFNYESKLPSDVLRGSQIFQDGVEENSYQHIGFVNSKGRVIIVSSELQSIASIYANFSFLFLVLVFTIIIVVLFYALHYGFSMMNINIASKIQIYLNIAFLLPLILVVSITLTIISAKFSESQQDNYLNQTESISINLMPAVDRFVQGKMSKQFLSDTINSISISTKKYISVFDTQGHLLANNKPFSLENGFLSNYINPLAYTKLMEEKDSKVILEETIGDLSFKTSYLKLKSNEGKLLGIVCIPFYDSKIYFTKEVTSVIGSMLNTFTTIFLILLWFSYLASNVLIVPLQLITNKLRKIDLSKPSEPLSWRSEDEIGVLIKAYNEMLVKLEESKVALTDANKQSAWQQMAKQVAHEIKNPLTPMKLSLQLLWRKLSRGTELDLAQVKDQIESLTGQIDNLSYIANSFSDFARLPIPKNEVFDFAYETRKVVNLFTDDSQLVLRMIVPNKPVKVIGDRQLTGNIIKNLIMNAIQSVPNTRTPEVMVVVEIGIEAITFSIQDNGIGIREEHRGKIFMLDYSTKSQGSGVGLALAKWVVDNAKGSIWFETVENEGTKFFFTLPLAPL